MRLPTVQLDTTGWTERQRAYIWSELMIAQDEAKNEHRSGGNRKAWFFFVGKQATNDQYSFTCDNHRLACCLFEEFLFDKQVTNY